MRNRLSFSEFAGLAIGVLQLASSTYDEYRQWIMIASIVILVLAVASASAAGIVLGIMNVIAAIIPGPIDNLAFSMLGFGGWAAIRSGLVGFGKLISFRTLSVALIIIVIVTVIYLIAIGQIPLYL